jgi:hypothetical protein
MYDKKLSRGNQFGFGKSGLPQAGTKVRDMFCDILSYIPFLSENVKRKINK